MFKKTERQLIMISVALVVVTAGAAWLFASHTPAWGVLAALVGTVLLAELWQGYKRLNKSVVFLLEALEHGDYSLRFAENTRAKRDANSTLNAIKEILIRARESEIKHERFLSLVMAAIPTGIVIIDERDFVRVANSAALRLLGMPYLTHVRQLEAGLVRALKELTPRQRATVRVANERDERLVSLGVSRVTSPMGEMRVVTMQNIADELQEREMESWTKLIRVMTHEIMNSIAPITSLAETMLATWEGMTLASNSLRRDTVDAFAAITATARDLMVFVESYRRFAGVAKPTLERVALVPLIENAVRLAGSAITSKSSNSSRAAVAVDIIASDPDIAVSADRGQIGQVLLNLLKNAAEAGATRIEVRISRGVFTEGNNPLHPDLSSVPANGGASMSDAEMQGAGGTVLVEVSDNGTPIPDDVLPHIFVPFFTTKTEGTGVGLSISRHIMRLHGGNLTHSTHNGRTLFELTFN